MVVITLNGLVAASSKTDGRVTRVRDKTNSKEINLNVRYDFVSYVQPFLCIEAYKIKQSH